MRGFLSFLATLLLAVAFVFPVAQSASAQQLYFDTVIMRDSTVNITADTSLAVISTQYAVWAQVSVELNTLGGSGTYIPWILTSIDGTLWDTLKVDTLDAALQNCVYTLSLSQGVATGAGTATVFGAEVPHVALSKFLKVYIDELAASTGSMFVVKAALRNTKYFDQ